MTDDEFDRFLDRAIDDLNRKQEHLSEAFGISDYPRWAFEQTSGRLEFFDHDDHLALGIDAVIIGSHALTSNTWRWGWANESVLAPMRERGQALKTLAEIADFPLFAEANAFEIEGEDMAWELAALAVQQLGATGCYRMPSGDGRLHTFLALGEPRRNDA